MYSKLTPKQQADVIRLLRSGLSNSQVVEALGLPVCAEAMMNWRKKAGLWRARGPKQPDWTPAEEKRLRRMTKSFITFDALLKHFPGRTLIAIKVKLKRLGINTVGTNTPDGIKWKQNLYPHLVQYYARHTRKETDAYAKEMGLPPALMKHFYWRIWPRYRDRPKSAMGCIRYSMKHHLAYLKMCETMASSNSRGRQGTFHRFARRYPDAKAYWGVPVSYAKALLGCQPSSLALFCSVKSTQRRAKGDQVTIVSWKELAKAAKKRKLDDTLQRSIRLMARFESWLRKNTRQWKDSREAYLFLINHRKQVIANSVRRKV